jgi:hypothetical protein
MDTNVDLNEDTTVMDPSGTIKMDVPTFNVANRGDVVVDCTPQHFSSKDEDNTVVTDVGVVMMMTVTDTDVVPPVKHHNDVEGVGSAISVATLAESEDLTHSQYHTYRSHGTSRRKFECLRE